MQRDILQPERYNYLTKIESDLYDRAKVGGVEKDEANVIIMDLLQKLAWASRGAHRSSRI